MAEQKGRLSSLFVLAEQYKSWLGFLFVLAESYRRRLGLSLKKGWLVIEKAGLSFCTSYAVQKPPRLIS